MAARDARTLTDREESRYRSHLATCERCRMASEPPRDEDAWRWIARVPDDAFDDPDRAVLPVVDPGVFVIERELATGGMGRVLRARDRRLGRDVALKEILDRDLHLRFEREARITARLQHQAIVPIYEAGTWPDGTAFYTMRLVPGRTLQAAITEARTLDARLALLHHVIAVTEAVAYAHTQRIVHRDLKPGNVLVGELGETVVIDWGLAKELDRADEQVEGHGPISDLTNVGAVLGTPGFMAPEQARGEPLDERADVYALGAILYSLLAGIPPFAEIMSECTPDDLVAATAARPARPIGDAAPDAPADLRAIVAVAMAFDKQARYPSAREMAEQLRRFAAGQLLARPYTIRELVTRWVRRHRIAVTIGAVAGVIVIATAILAIVNITRSRAAERDARVVAERARADSDRGFAALLAEQGRGAVLRGERDQALVYLSEAYSRGHDTVALRHMLGSLTRNRDLAITELGPFGGEVLDLAVLDAGEIAVIDATGELSRWRGTTRTQQLHLAGGLRAARLSADGTRVITVDATDVTMWDATTGAHRWHKPAAELVGDTPLLEFTPSAGRVAVAKAFPLTTSDDEQPPPHGVRLIDSDAGTVVATFERDATALAFSPSGNFLAACGHQGAWAWDPNLLTELGTLRTEQPQHQIGFVYGRRVVTADLGGARVWSFGSQTTVDIPSAGRTVSELSTSLDLVATAHNETVELSTVYGTSLRSMRSSDDIEELAFDRDGIVLALRGDAHLDLWDGRTLEPLATLAIDGLAAGRMRWGRDRLVVSTSDRRVRVVERPRPAWIGHDVYALLGDRWITKARDGSGALVIRSIGSGAEVSRIAGLDAKSVQVSSDERWGLLELPDNEWTVVDLTTRKRTATFMTSDRGEARLSRDGRRVAIVESTSDAGSRVRVIDAATGAVLAERQFTAAHAVTSAAPSADGEALVLRFAKHPPELVTVEGFAPRVSVPAPATHAVLDPTGRVLAAMADGARAVVLYDARTGAPRMTLTANRPPSELVFDTTGALLVAHDSVSARGTIELFDVASGQRRLAIERAHRDVALWPDGQRLAVATEVGIEVYDVDGGNLLDRLGISGVGPLSISPDGQHLLDNGELWHVGYERRAPDAVRAVAATVPWKLDGSTMVPVAATTTTTSK